MYFFSRKGRECTNYAHLWWWCTLHKCIIHWVQFFEYNFVINIYKKCDKFSFWLQLKYQMDKLKLSDTWPWNCFNWNNRIYIWDLSVSYLCSMRLIIVLPLMITFFLSYTCKYLKSVCFPLIYHFRLLTIFYSIFTYPQSRNNDYILMNRL